MAGRAGRPHIRILQLVISFLWESILFFLVGWGLKNDLNFIELFRIDFIMRPRHQFRIKHGRGWRRNPRISEQLLQRGSILVADFGDIGDVRPLHLSIHDLDGEAFAVRGGLAKVRFDG